jgi:hypothetical protein
MILEVTGKNNGVMECLSNGKMPTLHYSNTPGKILKEVRYGTETC